MSGLLLRFLGGMSISLEGHSFNDELAGKALGLICYLVVTSEAQTRSSLAGLLWSDFPEHRARSNLRDTLSILRKAPLAPFVQTSRRLIAFNSDLPHRLDLAEFQKGVQQSIQVRPVDSAGLATAIKQYRGEFLAGFHVPRAALFEEWVTVQRQQMHLLVIEALQRLVDIHLDAGNFVAGIPHARQLLILDAWREETHRTLMLLLFLNGQHNAALKQYQECHQILADELGVVPSTETKTLYENILKQIEATQPGERKRIVSIESQQFKQVPHNLPGQVTPFIGREDELRTIDNSLSDPTDRLITVLGAGGIGKTRLALALGERQVRVIQRDGGYRFPDGVFFVPLQAVESLTEIVPAFCQALGFQPSDEGRAGRSIERQLLDYVRQKRMLLIVDNFEQLLNGVGILAKIHRSARQVHLLVTSRQKLALHGERIYPLLGLPYPDSTAQVIKSKILLADYSAAGLFTATARRMRPDYHIQEEEVSSLIQICHLVDGLPLAIELAAGWVNLLSLADIAVEINQSLSFLESDLEDLPVRHRNLEAVFDVSWQQLSSVEQSNFSQLCIFRGGFTRKAAEQVAGVSLQGLALLGSKTLIQYDKQLDRYKIHRLLRQYGSEKLARDPATEQEVRERHCSFFTETLEQWDEQLKGAGQLEALGGFEDESANVRVAWYFAVEVGLIERLDEMVDGISRLYHWRRRFYEGEKACRLAEESLSQPLSVKEASRKVAERERISAKIMIWRSVFCEQQKARQLIEQALAILQGSEMTDVDTRSERALALRRAGDLVIDYDQDEMRRYYDESLALYRDLDDTWGTSNVLTNLGWVAAHSGEADEARRLGEEALVLRRSIGDRKGTADTLWLLGTLAILEGLVEESTLLLGESLDIRASMGDRITDIAAGPLDLGMTLTWIGRMADADEVRMEALALYKAVGLPERIAEAHVRLAFSKFHVGQFDAVQHHATIGLELNRKVGNQRLVGLAQWLLAGYALVFGEIDQAESIARESLSNFQAMEGAAEIGWVLVILAEIARRKGQFTAANKYIYEALSTASGLLGMITTLLGILSYVNLLEDKGQEERALEIRALLEKHPVVRMSLSVQMLYSARLAESAATLPKEVVAKAEALGRARDLLETASEILAELEEAIKD
jgi:predicted ATPase/DNA-binding SARP family transcriptional activator